MFLTVSPPFYAKERIAPFALRSFKSDLSDLLPLLFTKEWGERFVLIHNWIAKNEQIARKTDERIPNPAGGWQFNYSLIGPPFSTEE